MSRRKIEALNPNHECHVGYDRGMSTFFAQVEDKVLARLADEAAERVADAHSHNLQPDDADAAMCERETIIFWIGADRVGQVQTVVELAKALAPYAFIEPEMLETLEKDQREAEGTPRTKHERTMQEFINSNARS